MATSYWPLVETVWGEISIYDGPENFLSQFAASPRVARTLFAAHWCQSEVNNGGFGQFFGNSTGVLAPEAVVAYEAIGMPTVAGIVRDAMKWFGSPYPRERGVRVELLDRHAKANRDADDPFLALDNAFCDTIEKEAGGFEAAANDFSTHRDA
jgi:hypothetical protein